MHSLTLHSPAKLNLALRVLRRRKDGCHELVTLFHRISLKDTLQLRKRSEGIRLLCSHAQVPKKSNLIVRAFHLLKKRYPFAGGVLVRLEKRIPIGGGLGGGSGNAAAFLLGMNRLFQLRLTRDQLMKIGGELGSDIPYFISGARHAIGRGRGDRIEPLPFKRRLWFILFPSRRGLSTRRVYCHFLLRQPLTRLDHSVRMASAFLEQGNLKAAVQFSGNDLQESAEKIRPSLKKTRESLNDLQLGTCQMSGSGPTLFVVFHSQKKACEALRQFRKHRLGRNAVLCHSD